MKRKPMVIGGVAAGMAGCALLLAAWWTRPGPNVLRNPGFEAGLKSWGWYYDQKTGTRAAFAAQAVPGSHGPAARVSVTQASYYDSVELNQTRIALQAGHRYVITFRARSSVAQPLRVKIIKSGAPWTFYGFRAITEITPDWRTYRLTGRSMATAGDGKLMFQCGGVAADLWIDDVKFQDHGS